MKRLRCVPWLALLALGVVPAPVCASPITYDFVATQILSQPGGGGLSSMATPFLTVTGSITYDPAVLSSFSFVDQAYYPTGSIQINEFDISTGVFLAPFQISIFNREQDQLRLATTGGPRPNPPQAPGDYDTVQLDLYGLDGTTLSSTALPLQLSLFPLANQLSILRYEVNADGSSTSLGATEYDLTSLELRPTASPVPEPTSLILMGTGLLSFGARRWRRKAED